MQGCLVFFDSEVGLYSEYPDIYDYIYILKNIHTTAFDMKYLLRLKPTSVDNLCDRRVIDVNEFTKLYNKKVINSVVIPKSILRGQVGIVIDLLANGVRSDDIYIACKDVPDNRLLIIPYLTAQYLPYLEFHVADHCNLNCVACEHYSGLVKKPHYPIFHKFEQDLWKLHEFICEIGVIRILGGEPLLNDELYRFMQLTRRVYPTADIWLVTNGILLLNMSRSFYTELKINNIGVHISYYPPLKDKINSIKKMLDSNKIKWRCSDLISNFTIKQSLQKNPDAQDMFFNCYQARCNNLYEGKIAACFLPFTTKYFNEYFNQNIPEDGGIDLYGKDLTTEKLKKKLLMPFRRCQYCTKPSMVEWRKLDSTSSLQDWVR